MMTRQDIVDHLALTRKDDVQEFEHGDAFTYATVRLDGFRVGVEIEHGTGRVFWDEAA